MDVMLRLLQREASSGEPEAQKKYIAALERVVGMAPAEEAQLYAVLNDGNTDGDSLFDACDESFLPYKKGECQYSLLDKWVKNRWGGDDMSEYFDEITTIWIVDETTKWAVDQVHESGFGDSSSYAANSSRKQICLNQAIETIAFLPECPCKDCKWVPKEEITLYLTEDSEDGKQVVSLFEKTGLAYSIVPTYTLEVTQGPARYQGMNEIQEFLTRLTAEKDK